MIFTNIFPQTPATTKDAKAAAKIDRELRAWASHTLSSYNAIYGILNHTTGLTKEQVEDGIDLYSDTGLSSFEVTELLRLLKTICNRYQHYVIVDDIAEVPISDTFRASSSSSEHQT